MMIVVFFRMSAAHASTLGKNPIQYSYYDSIILVRKSSAKQYMALLSRF